MQISEALNKLDWVLWKQRDIVRQIMDIRENPENIQQVGYIPEGITPQALINLHKERYNILEVLKKCSEDQVEKWLKEAESRVSNECKNHEGCERCFLTNIEIGLLTEYRNQS